MANSDLGTGVRHVRCPKCHSLLQEPGVPVYQCGGCGATLRAKNRSGDTHDLASRTGLTQSTHLGSGDVASTSRPTTPTLDDTGTRRHGSSDVASTSTTPDATSRARQETNMASRRAISDIVSATTSDVAASAGSTPDVARSSRQATQEKDHDQNTNRGAYHSSEFRGQRNTDDAVSPGVSVTFPRGSRDATCESQVHTEKRTKGQAESPDAATKKHAAVRAQLRNRQEPAPKSSQTAAESKDVTTATAGGGKVRSPPRHELLKAQEDLAPLREKILKTVDALKGDLSELFTKSPNLNPTRRARHRPRLPRQEEGARASRRDRPRHAAAVVDHHLDSAARGVKHGHQVAAAAAPLRGLPSRRYRRCRADPPCCDNAHHHHGCCCRHHHHGKAPECGICRGHCGSRSIRAPDPSSAPRKPPAATDARKRRPPPRRHCRPVLKGAPFIICSSCFQLVQVPADFAVATNTLRKLRCGSCSAVLTYSYRDPARKKPSIIDQFSTDELQADPFVDGFGLSSYSTTEDEQPLHVSRNTSFDTLDGVKGVGRLHRLMGYGSASELLRRSPDLYESFDERTTPDYDRKGKGVCVDDAEDLDDSDDEDSGVLKRGAVWPLPGMPGKGAPGPGAIRIKS